MNWETAKHFLLENISVGDHIDPKSKYRRVLQNPVGKTDYLRISIGASSHINLTLDMLENVFNSVIANNGVYNRTVIYDLYPQHVGNHGCHVHVVGNIFLHAGIMTKRENDFLVIRNLWIK